MIAARWPGGGEMNFDWSNAIVQVAVIALFVVIRVFFCLSLKISKNKCENGFSPSITIGGFFSFITT